MEQKHNKQLHTEEYSIEYSTNEQQLIYEVISPCSIGGQFFAGIKDWDSDNFYGDRDRSVFRKRSCISITMLEFLCHYFTPFY